MEKESKEQKVWISVSETINTGDYENIKLEAGFSKIYTDKDDPVEMIETGMKEVNKIIKQKAKKIRSKL